jgi:hypothetical protein
METKKYITPGMKLSDLLNSFPELEDYLIEIVPKLANIKNKLLRNSIIESITIDIAAKAAGIEIGEIINNLRIKAGVENMTNTESISIDWANENSLNYILDARPIIEAGDHPLTEFLSIATDMKKDEVILLITPFLPTPLIDKASDKGLINHSIKVSENLYNNFFKKIG